MNKQILKTFAMVGFALAVAAVAPAQPFTSGSTGSDGAYAPTGTGTIYFNPTALGLDPSGDNVFNFTTINIPAGLTVKLIASNVRNQPVTWLATGNVTIAGVLDLSGASAPTLNATNPVNIELNRAETEPGPGGYAGGVGSFSGVGPEAGLGPGGGGAGQNGNLPTTCMGGAGSSYSAATSFTTYSTEEYGVSGTAAGATYGSPYLIPLYGGSGGGGGWDEGGANANGLGGIGGAGGGAIRIASNTQISVTGTINVNGGNGGSVTNQAGSCYGGPGAGGAIQLIAPSVTGTGTLTAISGTGYVGLGGDSTGFVRFNSSDTTSSSFTGTVTGQGASGPLYSVPANSTLALPSLTITQINGTAVPTSPTGSLASPDVQINAATAVTLNIAATNVPVATVVTLRVTSDSAADSVISCTPLAGTAASSTSTCSATFPYAVSLTSLRASW